MSSYTDTVFEELYSSFQAATTTTPTAGAVSMVAGLPPIIIPGGYFTKLGAESSSMKVLIAGQMTATATVPTFLMGLAVTTTSTFSATTPLAASGTFTPTAGTGAYFYLVADIGLRTIAQTATSVVVTTGRIDGTLLPSPFFVSLPATNVAPTMSTWDTAQQYYLWPYLTLGAATASNTVTLHMVKLYGEN